jgi:thioredoxin reductase (NADPH)
MANTHRTRVLIIGAGPAGYTAAIYAARANLKPILVQGMQPGGQLTITTEVENFPGFAEPIMGPDLMERMAKQAEAMGTALVFDMVTSVDFTSRPFTAVGDSGDTYVADAVIIATGAQARWLGVPGEADYRGYGMSACATCDGAFFRNREVAVIGGGNSAMEEALYLTNHASKVMLVHRRDALRGEKILQDRVFRNPKIVPVWNKVVESVVGEGGSSFTDPPRLTGINLRDTKTGAVSLLPVDGVFVAIGHAPATELFRGKLKTDEAGYLITKPDSTATEIDGAFAAGDVKDHTFRQAVTAAGMGCMAALEAERWLGAQ